VDRYEEDVIRKEDDVYYKGGIRKENGRYYGMWLEREW